MFRTLPPESLLRLVHLIALLTPVLLDLHWLPVSYCIVFKILLLVFKSLNNVSPSYLAPVFQKVDSAIHRTNLYPLDSAIGFSNTYSLDRDLSDG